MVRPKDKKNPEQLTPTELEFMQIIWRLGTASVHDVIKESPRKLAYTSVATIMRILEQKGALQSIKEGRSHTYLPLITQEQVEQRSLAQLVERVYLGDPAKVIRQLVDTGDLDDQALREIQALLQKKAQNL